MQREQIANGVYLNTLSAEKFNRCRLSLHFRFPTSKQAATDHALLALVMDRGYADCPDMTVLSRKLAKLYGASLSVETSIQGACRTLSVSISGIQDRFALAGEALSAEYAAIAFGTAFEPYLENGVFSEEAVRIEKATLYRQLESEINDKRLYCVRQARRKFYGDCPAGIERDGYLADLDEVTQKSVTDAYYEILRTAQIDVMAQGLDVAAVRSTLQQKLSLIDRKPASLPGNLFLPAQPAESFAESMDLVQAKLCMMFTMDAPADPDDMNLFRLAMSVYGASATSRLFLNVREKQSLCYYCGSRFLSGSACMMVDSGVEPANAAKAEAAILAELQQIVAGPITEEELENARKGLLSGLASVGDNLSSIENWYYSEIFRGGSSMYTPQQAAAQLNTITAPQIQAFLGRFTHSVSYLVTAKEGASDET